MPLRNKVQCLYDVGHDLVVFSLLLGLFCCVRLGPLDLLTYLPLVLVSLCVLLGAPLLLIYLLSLLPVWLSIIIIVVGFALLLAPGDYVRSRNW